MTRFYGQPIPFVFSADAVAVWTKFNRARNPREDITVEDCIRLHERDVTVAAALDEQIAGWQAEKFSDLQVYCITGLRAMRAEIDV